MERERYMKKHFSLKEKAQAYARLLQEPGWLLLLDSFKPELRTRISDIDSREALLYEAIRAQVMQEIFSAPHVLMQQAQKGRKEDPTLPER